VGVGAGSLVVGLGLVVGGAWLFSRASRRADALGVLLDANDYQREAGYRDYLHRWQERWHEVATGVIVSGAVLTAAGIGLTSWGAIRWRGQRRPTPPSVQW
jgi:hypothetical protein